MNFLQLCKEAAGDSGTVAGLPNLTTVAGATGRAAQLVAWVRDAWIDIQNERNDWLWMRRRFTGKALTIGQMEYSAANLDLTRVSEWLPDRPRYYTFTIYDPDQGQGSEAEMSMISYDQWIYRYGRRTQDTGRPSEWARAPDGKLLIGKKPDKAYVISGEYRLTPQELATDADIPEMPTQFHRLIIPEAVRLAARSDEAWQALTAQCQQYERLRAPLVREQTGTPDMTGLWG